MIVPYISREDVSAALTSLIHNTRKPAADGLQHLLLIDLLVVAPAMPESDEKRAFAVQELLVGEITQALDEQCALFRLTPPNERSRDDEAEREFRELVKFDKHHLLAWGILYYRYVRSDLDMSIERLAQSMAVTPRTISRYNDDGVELLTQRLIRMEQAARQTQIERHLYSMLPYSVTVSLVGRDDLLQSTEDLLVNLLPCHILITGTTGIGKTAFVQELLRHQIAANRLDHLIWLDRPASAQFAHQEIVARLLREGGEMNLRDYLMLYRVVVVLDGVDMIANDPESLGRLLRDLGGAVVFLINRVYVPLEGVEVHLNLPEINAQAADALVKKALRLHSNADSAHTGQVAHDLYRHIGGNPLGLRLAAGLWESSKNWGTLNLDIYERLFGQMFAAFNGQMKTAWCALSLLPEPIQLDQLAVMWGISAHTIVLLLQHGLVDGDGDAGYVLVGAAREYIHQIYAIDESVQRLFSLLVDKLNDSEVADDVFEQVLLSGFPELSLEQRAEWIRRLWKSALIRGHWAKWRMIFDDYLQQVDTVEPELRIAYGVCLRRLAEWEASQQIFYSLSLECGRSGDFAGQATRLLEWSVLARYRGEYERAQALLGQTKRYALRAQDEDLLHETTLQEAQFLIEQGNGVEAYKLLTVLPKSLHMLALQSEAQLILGNYNFCRVLAEQALKLSEDDQATQASLRTIIGRSYQAQHDEVQAHGYLTDALTLLERLDDKFALARAQTNLAAAFPQMKRYSDAGRLLTNAEEVQVRLGDRVGLRATRHNWNNLGGYIAR